MLISQTSNQASLSSLCLYFDDRSLQTRKSWETRARNGNQIPQTKTRSFVDAFPLLELVKGPILRRPRFL